MKDFVRLLEGGVVHGAYATIRDLRPARLEIRLVLPHHWSDLLGFVSRKTQSAELEESGMDDVSK